MKLAIERLDKDLRVLERREQISRSFVVGFIRLLYVAHAQIVAAAPYAMPDISNTSRSIDSQSGTGSALRSYKGNMKMGCGPGISQELVWPGHVSASSGSPANIVRSGHTMGIQVGSGADAVSPTDYALGTKIAHGRGAGELEYGGCELVNLAVAAPNVSFDIRRYFTNLSGGNVTVNEVGIYAAGTQYISSDWGNTWSFCIARDLLGAPVVVADTELLRVTYTPTTTV
jgi:hypothetical protein